jgi:hypothetical protein
MRFFKALTSKEFLKHIKALKIKNNRIFNQGNIGKEFVNNYKLVFQTQGIITKERKVFMQTCVDVVPRNSMQKE